MGGGGRFPPGLPACASEKRRDEGWPRANPIVIKAAKKAVRGLDGGQTLPHNALDSFFRFYVALVSYRTICGREVMGATGTHDRNDLFNNCDTA